MWLGAGLEGERRQSRWWGARVTTHDNKQQWRSLPGLAAAGSTPAVACGFVHALPGAPAAAPDVFDLSMHASLSRIRSSFRAAASSVGDDGGIRKRRPRTWMQR